jgi:hypothetical protein
VFERVFGRAGTKDQRLARMRQDRSILDFVGADLADLKVDLGARDHARLMEYLDDIREIERRIQRAEQQTVELIVPDAPVGVPDSFEEHATLMFDLLTLAYQADLTRVFTFMMAREFSQRTYPQVGVTEPHHTVSHHGNNAERIADHARVNVYHAGLLAKFLDRLRSSPDGDGSLLDHSTILYGSNMSNSNAHDHFPLPTLVVGGAAGRLKGGRHLKYPDHTPMANLLVSLLDKTGVEVDHLGDATGPLVSL